jgi:hypothetical protein
MRARWRFTDILPLPNSPPHPIVSGDDDLFGVLLRRVGADHAGGEEMDDLR